MSTVEYGNVGHDKHPNPVIKGGWFGKCLLWFIINAACVYMITLVAMFAGSLMFFPNFTVNSVKIYAFNVSTATSTLTSNLEITISSQNEDSPYLYLEHLDIYASYRNQQITKPIRLPPVYLGNPDTTVWSPYVNGTKVPLTPDLVVSLAQDVTAGTMVINVKVTGRIRSKYGFITTRYRLKVNCPVHIMFGNSNDSGVLGSTVKHPFYDDGCGIRTRFVVF